MPSSSSFTHSAFSFPSPKDIIEYFLYNVSSQKDLSTDKQIPSSELIILNFNDYFLYPVEEYLNYSKNQEISRKCKSSNTSTSKRFLL